MNPQMAAFYAGRGARDARMSADALNYGQNTLNQAADRAAALSRVGADRAQMSASTAKSPGVVKMLKGGLGIAKDLGAFEKGGMFNTGLDWLGGKLKNLFGGGGGMAMDYTDFPW
jgi:hypothetical protein